MQYKASWFKAVSALTAIAWIVSFGPTTEARSKHKEHVPVDSGDLSEGTEALENARREVLRILQTQNGCSAWFRETDPEVAETFRSLRLEVVSEQAASIEQIQDGHGGFLFKHPWAARTHELAGRYALVEFNLNGPFFHSSSPVFEASQPGAASRYTGMRALTIGSFRGSSLAAQMTTLLHELAHVIGRLPLDNDSWDGRSERNTREVLRNCKSEIRGAVRAVEHPEER